MGDLNKILRPKTIAAIGGNWAASVVKQCLLAGFDGTIWPVNPNRKDMLGIPCLPSIRDIPEPPDCTFIGVSREESISIMEYLAGVGAGGAVCFASGFAESVAEDKRGKKYQEELVSASGSIPFLGPNCYGMINYLDGIPIWPDVHGGTKCDTGVAIICQSSNIAINITMQSRGLPLGYVIASGNQAKISMAAIAIDLLEDPRVTAIGLYIEGFGDIREFEQLSLKARKKKIPIVVLKVGESEQATLLTYSHTSSIAGSAAGSRAFLKRLGFGQTFTIPEMIEALKILHLGGPLKGRKVASMSCSGGEACLMADLGSKINLDFVNLNSRQKNTLKNTLGSRVHLSNPLDYHTYLWGNEEELFKVFQGMMLGNQDLLYLVMDFPREDRCQGFGWDETLNAWLKAKEMTGARTAIVSLLPENMSENQSEYLSSQDIIPLCGLQEALNATDICADIGEGWESSDPVPIIKGNNSGTVFTADDKKIRHILSNRNVPFPRVQYFASEVEIESCIDELEFPVVLKAQGLLHKTEHGGVILNLTSAEALLEAANSMDSPNGFIVEEQVSNGVAEIMIGITNDIATGLMLTLGSGGIHSELWQDAQHLLLPVTKHEIAKTLEKLKIHSLLEGYRGKPGGDMECLIESIACLTDFAIENHETLVEIEINPFISLEKGGYAVDILARFTNESDKL
ncbi:MAG: acetate--CoA ligase family protein [Paracoccaceae bacterium]|nr:acetate--CoA ligase family protein [Paracoccaceae bacterium]MDE2916130.1 acetate--CoA ligase family protein [Paracoccaceae bacterium]